MFLLQNTPVIGLVGLLFCLKDLSSNASLIDLDAKYNFRYIVSRQCDGNQKVNEL